MFCAGNGLQRTERFAYPKLANWFPHHCSLQESWLHNICREKSMNAQHTNYYLKLMHDNSCPAKKGSTQLYLEEVKEPVNEHDNCPRKRKEKCFNSICMWLPDTWNRQRNSRKYSKVHTSPLDPFLVHRWLTATHMPQARTSCY